MRKTRKRRCSRPEATPIARAASNAAEDADIILRLWQAMRTRMVAEKVTGVYETLERPMPRVLACMEERGISVDPSVLSQLSNDFGKKQAALERDINKIAGTQVNPGSPKQLGDILFGQMGLPGGTENQDRTMVDRRPRAGRTGRARPQASAGDSRLAAGVEAAFDLYRSPAELRQSEERTASTPATHLRRHRPAGSHPPSRTCRTSRSGPRTAARSVGPSLPRPE